MSGVEKACRYGRFVVAEKLLVYNLRWFKAWAGHLNGKSKSWKQDIAAFFPEKNGWNDFVCRKIGLP